MFWTLLMSGYMAIVTTSATAGSYSILDTEQQWSPSQEENDGIEPTWEQLPWSQKNSHQTWHNEQSKEDEHLFDNGMS